MAGDGSVATSQPGTTSLGHGSGSCGHGGSYVEENVGGSCGGCGGSFTQGSCAASASGAPGSSRPAPGNVTIELEENNKTNKM